MSTPAASVAFGRAQLDPIRTVTWAVMLAALGIATFGVVDTPGFLTGENIRSILAQSAFVGVFAVATTVIMISGNLFSLSLAVTGAVAATTFLALLPHGVTVAILATLALGTVICAVQGVVVGAFGANPIIVTIAAGGLQEGVFLWATGGATIVPSATDTSYQWLNKLITLPWIGQLPVAVYVLFAVVAAAEIMLRLTRFGRLLFLTGENRRAARAAGLPTALVITGAFAVAGICTAIAGIELGAFNGSGSLLVESNFTYDGIAAAVVGGSAITGGRGSAARALGGALLMSGVSDIVLLRGYTEGWQILVKGVVVFAVVVVARLNRLRVAA